MLFSSALERSNNPHIELIVQTFLKSRYRFLLCLFDWKENSEKVLRQGTTCINEMKVCVRDTEINSFEITIIRFNAYKKCKSSIQNGFEKCGTSNQNILFSLF